MTEGRNNFQKNVDGCITAIKELTLNANNTSAILNAFKIHNTVDIREVYLEVSEGSITNLTALYLTSYDGTNTVDITADGVALSGAEVGAFAMKDDDAAEVLKVNLNTQVRKIESVAAKDTYQQLILTQKYNTDTYIRLHYTTTETPIDAKIKLFIHYRKTNGGYLETL